MGTRAQAKRNLLFLSEIEDSQDVRDTRPKTLEQQLTEQFGTSDVKVLGAPTTGMIDRETGATIDSRSFKPEHIIRTDHDIEKMRKVLQRVIVTEYATDERVQKSIDIFLGKLRLACLEISSNHISNTNDSILYLPVVDTILNYADKSENEGTRYRQMTESETQVMRGVCRNWAMKNFPIYRFASLVAGALGYYEPRNLLAINHAELMMTRGVELIHIAADLDKATEEVVVYNWLSAFFKKSIEDIQRDDNLKKFVDAISQYIIVPGNMSTAEMFQTYLSSNLHAAVLRAYDFLNNHVQIKIRNSINSKHIFYSRYSDYVDVVTGSIKMDIFFDDSINKAPGYISFNPELLNLVTAYIPRYTPGQGSKIEDNSVMISKRRTDLVIKAGLMGI